MCDNNEDVTFSKNSSIQDHVIGQQILCSVVDESNFQNDKENINTPTELNYSGQITLFDYMSTTTQSLPLNQSSTLDVNQSINTAVPTPVDSLYNLKVVANKDTVLLYCISKLYKIDYPSLLFLYEKSEKDLIYIFYIFSGKKISFPTSSKFQSLVFSADTIIKFIKDNNDTVTLTPDEQELVSSLNNLFDFESEKIVVPLDIIYNIV